MTLISYGHAHGPLSTLPTSHLVTFSVRDLPNPPAALRKTHTGLSKRLRKEVLSTTAALQRLDEIVEAVERRMHELDGLESTGVELVVGVCCEEGRHRSVSIVEELGKRVKVQGWNVEVRHRDLERGDVKGGGKRKERKRGKWNGIVDGDDSE
jgi:RNase adaptor protein for sRNA GlmZ degradation